MSRAAASGKLPFELGVLEQPAGEGRVMEASLSEQLRVVGQWLDAHAAQGAEITCEKGGVCVGCVDDERAEQRVAIASADVVRWSERAARERKNPFGTGRGRWSARLRTLGQRLEVQGLLPTRIWSDQGHLYVRVQYQQECIELDYLLEELDDRDRVERNQRLVRGLRLRKPERWWEGLRAFRIPPQVSAGL
jgi:hypothetical protein